jgi:hypothetical protein
VKEGYRSCSIRDSSFLGKPDVEITGIHARAARKPWRPCRTAWVWARQIVKGSGAG